MPLSRRVTAVWRFARRPLVLDVALVVVLAAIAITGGIMVLRSGHPDDAVRSWLFAAATIPLLVRRSRPVLVAAVTTGLDVAFTALGTEVDNNLPAMIAFYSVGRHATARTAWLVGGGGAAGYGVLYGLSGPGLTPWVPGVIFPLASMLIGQFFRLRAELKERGTREAADAAVRAERRRIARELHDVVAHHLSVINALVGGARATLPPEQEVAHDALAGAERTARRALSEMRQLLDVLRADDGGTADMATGVGAARLPALVQEAGTAGLPASLTVTGEATELPAAVDHAVYRIVQEALTNTRKHAVRARASVRLDYLPEAVEVEVLDDGRPRPVTMPQPPGFGLGGMAERVALCGGRLSTGPREEGGFRVHARIPLEKA